MKATTAFSDYPNVWGSFASGLCLIHCVATPFLFVAHTGHVHGHHTHPFWWGLLDIFFITLSFLAVYWSARNTSKYWMKVALWGSWAALAAIILNEKLELIALAETWIYLPSMALVVLHLRNRRYCQCKNDSCCSPLKENL